jgi:gamma-glutamylcyclotransferase (GGCT)/AIG2-like uncharacterized protein YtfP
LDNVFVYGTLMSGEGNNRLLDGCTRIGEAVTEKPFALHNVGFPVTFYHKKGKPVLGELWEIPGEINDQVIARLDRLEAEGRMYQRHRVRVLPLASTEPSIETWMYVGIPQFWVGILNKPGVEPNSAGFLSWREYGQGD